METHLVLAFLIKHNPVTNRALSSGAGNRAGDREGSSISHHPYVLNTLLIQRLVNVPVMDNEGASALLHLRVHHAGGDEGLTGEGGPEWPCGVGEVDQLKEEGAIGGGGAGEKPEVLSNGEDSFEGSMR